MAFASKTSAQFYPKTDVSMIEKGTSFMQMVNGTNNFVK
jgi:hypothetical protein